MERVLQIVGGGRMGEALLGGLIAAGRAPESLAVVEVFAARREQLASAYPGVTVADAPVSAPDALIAVKPGDVHAAVSAVAEAGAERALSVVAGVTTSALEESGRLRIVRAMPNTPALIGAGASAIAPGSDATDEDMAWAEEILGVRRAGGEDHLQRPRGDGRGAERVRRPRRRPEADPADDELLREGRQAARDRLDAPVVHQERRPRRRAARRADRARRRDPVGARRT